MVRALRGLSELGLSGGVTMALVPPLLSFTVTTWMTMSLGELRTNLSYVTPLNKSRLVGSGLLGESTSRLQEKTTKMRMIMEPNIFNSLYLFI